VNVRDGDVREAPSLGRPGGDDPYRITVSSDSLMMKG
jgi:hypothetical protein